MRYEIEFQSVIDANNQLVFYSELSELDKDLVLGLRVLLDNKCKYYRFNLRDLSSNLILLDKVDGYHEVILYPYFYNPELRDNLYVFTRFFDAYVNNNKCYSRTFTDVGFLYQK